MNINFSPTFKQTTYKTAKAPAFKAQMRGDIFISSQKQTAIPEFLYHLTNSINYEAIKKSGQLRLSKDIIDGVFLFDMKDFQTNWRNTKLKNKPKTLAHELVSQALKGGDSLVLLQVPTRNLDAKKFAIRPQDDVLDFVLSDAYRNLEMVFAEKGGLLNNKQELPRKLVKGLKPEEAPKFFQKGRPVEFVYKDNIDFSRANVRKVLEFGECDLEESDRIFDKFQEI